MNFDDKDNDYFLHNFKEGEGESHEKSPEPTVTRPDAGGTTIDFTTTGSVEKPRRRRHGWRWFFFIVIVALGVTVYIRYFVPHVTESRSVGYVTNVEKRGILFHTFEGEMIMPAQLADTSHVYSRDFTFSIPDDSLARVIQSYQGTGKKVALTCKKYYGTLPWRGASKTVVTSIEPY